MTSVANATASYSGPALLSTTTSASPTTPLATQPSVVTVVSDNEPDSDVAMRSRSGSPDIPLAETAKEDPKIRYPQGNGLGNPGSSRNPDGSNCTRPVVKLSYKMNTEVELPCTGDYPTCVNCIRRNRVCAYPEPASYAHQFPRQSAMHARQLKNGPSSPGKSLSGSPGKRIPGTVDAVLSTARTGILGGGPVSIRDIVDPPHGGTRGGVLDAPPRAGVLDTPPRGTIETTNNTPRGTLDAPRNSLEPTHAPQPTLYTSRPLNRSQATPTPPSMSVSPNSSGGASIQVLGATPKTSDQNGTLPARSEKEPSEGWSGRSRTGSTSADMSRTLSDINLDQYRPPIQPQPQSQPQPHPNSQRASPISPIQAANRPQPAPPYNPGGRTQSPPKLTVQVTNSGSPRTAPRPVVSTGLSSRPGPSLGRYGDIPPRETYQDGRPNGSEFRSRARPPVNGRDRRDSFDKDRRESFSERDRERDRDRRDSLMSRRDSFDRDRDRDRERDRERWDSYDRDRDRDRERERERERRDSIRGPPPPSTWATARDPPPPRLDIRPLIVPPDPKVTSPVVYARPPSARSSPADMEMDSNPKRHRRQVGLAWSAYGQQPEAKLGSAPTNHTSTRAKYKPLIGEAEYKRRYRCTTVAVRHLLVVSNESQCFGIETRQRLYYSNMRAELYERAPMGSLYIGMNPFYSWIALTLVGYFLYSRFEGIGLSPFNVHEIVPTQDIREYGPTRFATSGGMV
ncbi:hypothetical protein AG1IA_03848 [Rhizoctonia solani AG-1 IA]|uniref:Uncharacterized protein n=1 Tax=Thanatephorus cucumeris (strain AG1-IA) TaxID=983506 RepID=L8WVU9_THACA|nr:hypothetical protein AG1IA_03848 [Rhizoctonia solani AG-1 IA]